MNKILISIIIPAYNEEKLIRRCLISLTKQNTSISYEIIVIDNNSTDNTVKIANFFPIRLLTEKIQNVVVARQKGLENACGDIISCADADSYYPDNWIDNIAKQFSIYPQIVGLVGSAIPEKKPRWAYWLNILFYKYIALMYKISGKVVYAGGFNFSFRRDIFLKLGGYNTYLDHGGDEFDVLYRLQKVGKVIYAPNVTMHMSTRCYRIGFFRWFFVELCYYYILNYCLASIFKRQIIHPRLIRPVN